jgi:hypothetical protein
MPTDKVLIEYSADGLNELRKAQLALAQSYEGLAESMAAADKTGIAFEKNQIKIAKATITSIHEREKLNQSFNVSGRATDKVSASSDRLITRMGKLSSFGRDLRQAGGFLGNDTLYALGNFADGMGDVAQSIDAVSKSKGKLGKAIGIGGAVLGGIGLGTQIYDATIGKAQGTDTGTILNQIGQLISAGFNPEILKVKAENAYFSELKGVEFAGLQREISNIGKSPLDKLSQMGLYGGPRDKASMEEALKLAEEYIKKNPSFNPTDPNAVYRLQAELIAAGIRKELSDLAAKLASKESAETITNTIQRLSSVGSAFSSLQSASQLASGRKSQADSLYSQSLKLIAKDVADKRLDLAKSYNAQTLEADRQYYAQRAELAQQYGVETQRAEEDHQRNIQRLSQDHTKRLKKLVESRDALAVEDEIEAYQDERQRMDEDYQVAARRRSEDYANQLQQMEQAHREQEQQRRAAYQQQLVDLQTYAQLRRNQEAVEYGKLLKDIVQAFTDARNAFAASISNSNNVTTNKTANVTTNITGPSGGISLPLIEQTVYGAIEKAMR